MSVAAGCHKRDRQCWQPQRDQLGNDLRTSASSTAIFTQRTFSLTNSGTISGTTGIRDTVGTSTITDAGTITGTGGTAISFTGSGNTLTRQPGSVINGNVLSTGSSNSNNIFQLGGTGTATFDVSSIGTSAQYRDFDTFNKVGARPGR